MYFNQVIIFAIGVIVAHSASGELTCTQEKADIDGKWRSMTDPCLKKMQEQVNVELGAALTYMAMGGHFAQDTVNRPGFSKMFFESANEEREHAIKIISYMLMRGYLTENLSMLIKNAKPEMQEWTDGITALKNALALEVTVTEKIQDIIKVCENPAIVTGETSNFNDYHLVDYLTGEFLEEQLKGQREIAGKISTLGKMMNHYGPIGEFLFDKKLLNGEPM